MANITINSNISSLSAQRRLNISSEDLMTSYTKLASGLRINKASDDAAGLAIASALATDRRVFNQAIRNLNDGVSAISIADSSVESLSGIVMRLQELAEQAANGTIGNKQRQSLDAEAQALSKEYSRIIQGTKFNEQGLLNGSLGELKLQGGYGENGSLVSDLGGAIGTGEFELNDSYDTGLYPSGISLGDLNGDGIQDLITMDVWDCQVSVLISNGDGSFKARSEYEAGLYAEYVDIADLNGDGILDLATADWSAHTASILLGNGDGSFKARVSFETGNNPDSLALGDLNGDGIFDLVTTDTWEYGAAVMLGNGDGSFKARTLYSTNLNPRGCALEDLNGDGILDLAATNEVGGTASILLGNGDGSFGAVLSYATGDSPMYVAVGDVNNDGIKDLVTADLASDQVSILLGNGDGSFRAHLTFGTGDSPTTVVLGDLNGDNILDIVTSDIDSDQNSILLGNGDGSFEAATTLATGSEPRFVSLGDVNGDGVLDILTTNRDDNQVSIYLAKTTSGTSPLLPFSLATLTDAREALPVFQRKLSQLSFQRAQMGAFESRIGVAINNLKVASENYATAESQITDTDIAEESANLVRKKILQQAGASILAQANSEPELALVLLNGG